MEGKPDMQGKDVFFTLSEAKKNMPATPIEGQKVVFNTTPSRGGIVAVNIQAIRNINEIPA